MAMYPILQSFCARLELVCKHDYLEPRHTSSGVVRLMCAICATENCIACCDSRTPPLHVQA